MTMVLNILCHDPLFLDYPRNSWLLKQGHSCPCVIIPAGELFGGKTPFTLSPSVIAGSSLISVLIKRFLLSSFRHITKVLCIQQSAAFLFCVSSIIRNSSICCGASPVQAWFLEFIQTCKPYLLITMYVHMFNFAAA